MLTLSFRENSELASRATGHAMTACLRGTKSLAGNGQAFRRDANDVQRFYRRKRPSRVFQIGGGGSHS